MKAAVKCGEEFTQPMSFESDGYSIIEMPELKHEELASFNKMPRDRHSLQRHRTIRLTQYFGYCETNQWIFAPLPKRHYVQSLEYIKLSEAGGVPRYREQLQIDPSSLIARVMDNLPVDRAELFHVNVNQIRVTVNKTFKGVTVPEGPHRDGHEYSVIAVATRHNVCGGETQVIEPKTNHIVFRKILAENEAILIDDERYIHFASNIEASHGEEGYRDIWVIEINRWKNRAYGPLHDLTSCKGATK